MAESRDAGGEDARLVVFFGGFRFRAGAAGLGGSESEPEEGPTEPL